ncbi:hydrolase, partial [Streptomyces sp. TRM76130]|nr:hydrolase [Streptomyces sp. TRM76130]
RAWRRLARATVEEHLVVDDQHGTPYDPEFTDGPEGDGYRRQSVTLSLTRHTRVRGSLLTPHGPGPFPAVLLLHDHGARFDIGKEKFVRPWDDATRLASAQAWVDKLLGGRFVGDELARRGYAVLCLDALGWGDRGPVAYEQQQA